MTRSKFTTTMTVQNLRPLWHKNCCMVFAQYRDGFLGER